MRPIQPETILEFWFSAATEANWFVRSDAMDQHITDTFAGTYEAARAGELEAWKSNDLSALALVILLDQFPRNMFRGSPRAFESDAHARTVAGYALEQGFDQLVTQKQRQFVYLPFMHSENVEDQRHAVRLYEQLGITSSLDFARQHADIIERFGRFPHRNAVLGRQNTREEDVFLIDHKGF